ncbi:MAG: DinB family protein [Thermoanaerobaculia bacterium]
MRSAKGRTLLIWLTAVAGSVLAEEPPKAPLPGGRNPMIAYNREAYEGVKGILLRSAENMPEQSYGFRPADSVRTYGQIIGHVADAQYLFCSLALGETNPAPKIEKTKTSKADLVAALKEAFAYCDRASGAMTEATATRTVTLFGGETPKLGVLEVNSLHSVEHYGNLVTYMRMKGIVPPTSEPAFQAEMKK